MVTYDLDAAPEWAELATTKKILVVDDEIGYVEMLRGFMEEWGYAVDTAPDGMLGIGKVMANDYAAIVSDVMMPNLGGDMFYRAVGRVKPHLCQRFIFITGLNEDPRVDALLRKVRARVLYKPFDPDAMLEAIQQLEKRAGAVAVGMA